MKFKAHLLDLLPSEDIRDIQNALKTFGQTSRGVPHIRKVSCEHMSGEEWFSSLFERLYSRVNTIPM
jgi:hypothetical protein